MPPDDRDEGVSVLGVVAWLGLFAFSAWAVHEALSFFPEGWRWTNEGRGRARTMSLRQTLSLTLALPLSLYGVALWGELRRRLRGEPSPCEEEEPEPGPPPRTQSRLALRPRPRRHQAGCGAVVLVLTAATAALRPAALLLFPLVGLDPERGGLLPFALWIALVFAGFSILQAAAALRASS